MVPQVENTLFKKGNDMRVTRKVLQEQVDTLNGIVCGSDYIERGNCNGGYALDEAHIYGGYCLTSNKGSHHVCGRRSAKEMYSYLEAAIAFSPITQGYQRFNVDAMDRGK